jgi:hypothetical protein
MSTEKWKVFVLETISSQTEKDNDEILYTMRGNGERDCQVLQQVRQPIIAHSAGAAGK